MPGATTSEITIPMLLGGTTLLVVLAILIVSTLCAILAAVRRGRVTLEGRISKIRTRIDLDLREAPNRAADRKDKGL